MNEHRLVFDVNVLVSAAIWPKSVPGRALVLAGSWTLLRSDAILEELTDVLNRPKFDKYAPIVTRAMFLERFSAITLHVEIRESIRACRDPKDDKYLELAVSGKADVIVTGDADLLTLHPFRGIAILSPADFAGRAEALGSPT